MVSSRILKVLIIDDSAYNRRVIADFVEEIPEAIVVGKASDGQEGLQMALNEHPDVITLDLEMPRMDGFSFLRLIMSNQPTPVIVISSHSDKENVFRALELGALDFVAKPSHRATPEILELKDEVINKIRMAGQLKPTSLHRLNSYAPADLSASGAFPVIDIDNAETFDPGMEPHAKKVVVMAASTGGPPCIMQILSSLPADLPVSILVAQHMPPKFTTTFSERLDRQCAMRVMELTLVEMARKGVIYICPGDKNLELTPGLSGTIITAVQPKSTDRYVPSADYLFRSAASALRKNVMAVVLTGMGDDGANGSVAVASVGGPVLVESVDTAVVDGMPQAVLRTGTPAMEEPLERIAQKIVQFAHSPDGD